MRKPGVLILIGILLLGTIQLANAAAPVQAGKIEGFVKTIKITAATKTTPKTSILQVEKYTGQLVDLVLADQAVLTIDEIPVQLDSFKTGMEVYGQINNNKLLLLEGFSTSNPAYISPQSRMKQGLVVKIESDQITVRQDDGKQSIYFLTPATVILKNASQVTTSSIYTGDRVKLYFDEFDTTAVSRIQIEGPSIVVKDLCRGKLNQVDLAGQNIGLQDIQVWRNGQWEDYKPSCTLTYNRQSPVYLAGQIIVPQNLKYYRGKTVYMAVNNKLGRDSIEKMVINNQYASSYKDKITSINWYAGALELENKRNFTFNNGAIIIQNGRLLDSSVLDENMDTILVADSQGIVNVINVLDTSLNNNTTGQHRLFQGRLELVAGQELRLKEVSILNNNRLESYSSEQTMQLSDETVFFDTQNQKRLSLAEFKRGNYAVDENTRYARNNNLTDWYGYIYTDGEMVIAALLQKYSDSLSVQRVSTGIVMQAIDDPQLGWVADLQNMQDWSNINQQWMLRSNQLRLILNKALIIKDDRMMAAEDLKPGDHLYLLRDDVYGKVLIVK